jgi:hypothetical protein
MNRLPPLKITEDGHTYTQDLLGERVCTGARMGLPNYLPADSSAVVKLRLVVVRLDSGGYAPNGAYFGRVHGRRLYHAESVEEFPLSSGSPGRVRVFVKEPDRAAAKAEIRKTFLPNATFFR